MIIEIVKQDKLIINECEEMFKVFTEYYENTEFNRFLKDMKRKTWIILMYNDQEQIVGFSTVEIYNTEYCGKETTVLYSGDTVVKRNYRTAGHLAGAFGQILIRSIKQSVNVPVFWMLTSKGIRTYRFLPVFFKEFFPAYNKDAEANNLKNILDYIAVEKFGSVYSKDTQILTHFGSFDKVKISEHTQTLLKRNDPHIDYFLRKNPGYINGDELACVTPITNENFNKRSLRVIEQTKVNWRE